MDRTTRAVRERLDDEAEKRRSKMARLREARLEKEANMPPIIAAPKSKVNRKTLQIKSI